MSDPLYQPIFWAAVTANVANAFNDLRNNAQNVNISLSTECLCAIATVIGCVLGRVAGAGMELSYANNTLINFRGLVR